MVRGFYNLASGMNTQRKNLNVIASNMANVATTGFKSERALISSTFQEEMMVRTGNSNKSNPQELGTTSMARIARETITSYEQGDIRKTSRPLDIAIVGEGFFELQNAQGERIYTRNGAFNINDDGNLCTQEGFLVLGANGQPLRVADPANTKLLDAEQIVVDNSGYVYDAIGNAVGKLSVVNFADTSLLVKQDGYFIGQGQTVASTADIMQRSLEGSNVDALKEMVTMIESQRSLQSASQVLKMYDQMLNKAVTQIANI